MKTRSQDRTVGFAQDLVVAAPDSRLQWLADAAATVEGRRETATATSEQIPLALSPNPASSSPSATHSPFTVRSKRAIKPTAKARATKASSPTPVAVKAPSSSNITKRQPSRLDSRRKIN